MIPPAENDILATAREWAERDRSLQTFINDFGPPRPPVGEARSLCCAWKAAAKNYRGEVGRLKQQLAALQPYLQHRPDCGYSMVGPDEFRCECGLLNTLAQEEQP